MIDKWIWREAMFTVYMVKATYNHLKGVEQGGVGDFLAKFWKLKTLPSTQVTTWRVLTNSIATKDNLLRRDLVLVNNLCPLFSDEVETVNRLFFECKVSWRIWALCFEWLELYSEFHYDAMDFMLFKPLGTKEVVNRCRGGFG